jgi:hypothetical protein
MSSGYRSFSFNGGMICCFDHTGRIPLVCIYGAIFDYWVGFASFNGPFGRPITDVVDLSDGGRCCITEGGHIHAYGTKVVV